MEEIFKLDKAFLYDFLGATQEHVIKPKRFAEMHIDEVLMGGTNNPEFEQLIADDTMEAFRDRTTRLDVPYVVRLSAEQKIYHKVFNLSLRAGAKHIAPHTIEMASLWSILTRLHETGIKGIGITLREKVRLYDGRVVPGYTDEHAHDLLEEFPDEGLSGISPRYIQDKIAAADAMNVDIPCVLWFAVKKELEAGLVRHPLIKKDQIDAFKAHLASVDEEFNDLVKEEVQEAIAADEGDVAKLFEMYLESVVAFVQNEKILDHRNERVEPNEELMRSVEALIGASAQQAEEYRRQIVVQIGARATRGETFDYKTDEQLFRGLRLKLFEDRKDTIKLSTILTGVTDEEEQEKIELVKRRLIAATVLTHVASIFARGAKPDKNS